MLGHNYLVPRLLSSFRVELRKLTPELKRSTTFETVGRLVFASGCRLIPRSKLKVELLLKMLSICCLKDGMKGTFRF